MRGGLFLWFVVGCSGSSFDIPPSTDGADTAVVDASGIDSAVDSATEEDTNPPSDSAADTTTTLDAKPDAKVDAKADALPPCPAPRSTKTHEVTTTDCAALRAQHAAAVAAAKKCNCDADCSDKLDPNLCGCQSFANPGREEYLLAIALEDQHTVKGCATPCVGTCKVPLGVKCVLVGETKICQDQF